VNPSLGDILILEDDPDLGPMLSDFLEAHGFRPHLVTDGRDALSALVDLRPLLMLVDLMMPGMNGAEFLGVIRNTPHLAGIPRVIMTGANDRMIGVREDAPVLYKPIDLEALLTICRSYV
jgi:DNA-binding response OmpR family regulator